MGGDGFKNCQFYLVKRQLRGGGGQKSPILRGHGSLWTAPKHDFRTERKQKFVHVLT